jgi:hypothetical protein
MSTSSVRSAMSLFGAFIALAIAWMTVLPLFAGPDEPANFIKSAAVVRGQFVGEPIPASVTTSFWSTYVDIDPQFGTAQLVPWCFVGQPQTPACSAPLQSLAPVEPARTDMGRYPPLGFVPAGIGTLLGPSDTGVRAARLTAAVVCCAMLTVAAQLLRRRRRSLVPLLVAATPGVVFLSSVSSPSGVEIVSAIAAWTALWIGIHERWSLPSTIAVFVGASALLIVARPAGIVAVIVMVACAAIADHDALRRAALRHPRELGVMAAAVTASIAWYVTTYDHNFGVRLDVERRVTSLTTIASRSLIDLPRLVAESVGNFGWLDTPSPTFAVWIIVGLTATLAIRAAQRVSVRHRLALGALALCVPVWHIALNTNYQDLLGSYGSQGRHLTPLIVGLPLAAVMRRAHHPSDSSVAGLVLCVHAWCVLVALRRYSSGAGGDDLLGFVTNPAWTPPLGMATTLFIVALAHIAAWWALRGPRRS